MKTDRPGTVFGRAARFAEGLRTYAGCAALRHRVKDEVAAEAGALLDSLAEELYSSAPAASALAAARFAASRSD